MHSCLGVLHGLIILLRPLPSTRPTMRHAFSSLLFATGNRGQIQPFHRKLGLHFVSFTRQYTSYSFVMTMANSTKRLEELRKLMKEKGVDVYSNDHLSPFY